MLFLLTNTIFPIHSSPLPTVTVLSKSIIDPCGKGKSEMPKESMSIVNFSAFFTLYAELFTNDSEQLDKIR